MTWEKSITLNKQRNNNDRLFFRGKAEGGGRVEGKMWGGGGGCEACFNVESPLVRFCQFIDREQLPAFHSVTAQCTFCEATVTTRAPRPQSSSPPPSSDSAARAVRFRDVIDAGHAPDDTAPEAEDDGVGIRGGRQRGLASGPAVLALAALASAAAGSAPPAAVQEPVAVDDGQRAHRQRGGRADSEPEVEAARHRWRHHGRDELGGVTVGSLSQVGF